MTPLDPEDLTVVVSAVGRRSGLDATLRSLLEQRPQGFATVVLVHEADPPISPPDRITLLRIDTAMLPRTYDAGLAAVETPYALVLPAGVRAVPGLVAAHLTALAANRAVEGALRWDPDAGDTALRRWLAMERDSLGGNVLRAGNVSFPVAAFRDAAVPDEAEPSPDEAAVVVRLIRAGVAVRPAQTAGVLDARPVTWGDAERELRAAARSEHRLAVANPAFAPRIRARIFEASDRRPVARCWPAVADRVRGPLRRHADARAFTRLRQEAADVFTEAYDGQRDLDELREYLGDRYDHEQLVHHTAAVEEEEEASADEAAFYRSSEAYLYDLTVFAMSGTKAPYRRVIRSLVPPAARILDFGCGLGSDGLRLLEQGYAVEFADFDNPSTRFLRWRLDRRGRDAPVHDVDVAVPDGFDLAFCFDVIEHIDDPVAFLEDLERKAAVVVVNFLEPDPHDVHLHKPLDVPRLVERAADRGLLWYRRYHGRSHLVAYATGSPPDRPAVPRVLSQARRWLGPRLTPRPGTPST